MTAEDIQIRFEDGRPIVTVIGSHRFTTACECLNEKCFLVVRWQGQEIKRVPWTCEQGAEGR